MIDTPGIYNIPMSEYLDDPCPGPSLSAGNAGVLLGRSPAHARANHPRLGNPERDNSSRADLGTAMHSACLGGASVVYCPVLNGEKAKRPGEVVTAWQSTEAKQWRDTQYARGNVPLLQRQRSSIEKAVGPVHKALADKGHVIGSEHVKCEQTVIAKLGDIWVRTRPDLIDMEQHVVVDLKSADNAEHTHWQKRVLWTGYHRSGALYTRALEEVTGVEWTYRWLAQEFEEPFAYTWHELDIDGLAVANEAVDRALKLWGRCVELNDWPAYSDEINYAAPPAWMSMGDEQEIDWAALEEAS